MNGMLITCLMSISAAANALGSAAFPPPQEITVDDVKAEVAGNNDFALRLYDQLAGEEGNLFLSPYSIRTALAMTYSGARGRTAEEMRKALRLARSGDALARTLARLADELAVADGAEGCELAFANSLWGQMGMPFRPEFLSLLGATHGAGYHEVDYTTALEDARRVINDWVASKTRNRIEALLEEGDLDGETVLVLVNAVYFQGAWPMRFAAENTVARTFFVPPAEGEDAALREISVPTMYQQREFGHLREEDLSVLELPYAGDRLSMVVFLPRDRDGLGRLEASLSPAFLVRKLAQLRPENVGVFLPRFSVSSRFGLKETLRSMGMVDAFGHGADFSGMTKEEVFVEDVIPAAHLTVDERGTEAAGASSVVMEKRGGAVFRADHPFLFLIRDRQTGTILFLGRVTDPSQG